jgi:hypothetical protein
MINKAITITSLNMRSLGRSIPKQKEIRTWITSLAIPLQIPLLQKHHLGKRNASLQLRESSFGKEHPFGTMASQWDACKD